eukprot:745451-Ditylum_brightwellii.AAC.1
MGQQPQTAFAGFAQSLQCKWAYLQQSMELTGYTFDRLEEAIHKHLLLALFEVPVMLQDLQDLAALSVRHRGLGSLNPTKETPRNRATSEECTTHLKDTSLNFCIFESNAHTACLEQGRIAIKKRKDEEYECERKEIETFYTEDCCCSEERAGKAGKAMNNWLMVVPRTANNMILNKEEFRDQVLMRYFITPNGLLTICACGKHHTLNHALQCKIDRLVGGRHDEARDNL